MLNIEDLFDQEFHFSFRCYYDNGQPKDKHQVMKLSLVPKWIDGYKFTHPNCKAITVKVWFDSPKDEESEEE